MLAIVPAASPFAGKADMRLTKVRLFIMGACTKNSMLTAILIHAGPETLVDIGGIVFPFYYIFITRFFFYRLSDKAFGNNIKGAIDGDISNRSLGNVVDMFALIGLFII